MSMGFGTDYDELGYDTGLVSKEDIYDPAADLFDDGDDRDDFAPEALERYLKQLQEQKEQQKREMKARKKEMNLPHKLRMDIDDAKLILMRDKQGLSFRRIAGIMKCSPQTVINRYNRAKAKSNQ